MVVCSRKTAVSSRTRAGIKRCRGGVVAPPTHGFHKAANIAQAFYSSSYRPSMRGNMEYRTPMNVLEEHLVESQPLAAKCR